MIGKIIPAFFIFFTLILTQTKCQQQFSFDKPLFYNAMADKNIIDLDNQLNAVKISSIPEKEAYEGALLMKKAGLVSNLSNKLKFFKTGHKKLETAIKKEENNTEFRFLRLMIQENAPKIVNYHNDLQKDALFIRTNYKNMPPFIQQFIIEYSKKSKVLKSL